MGTKILGWLIVLGAAAGGLFWMVTREDALVVEAQPVARGYVEQTVTAISSGTVKPQTDARITAETFGRVVAIPVAEGERVQEGDLLVELAHTEADANVDLAEANLAAARARLEQIRLAAGISEDLASSQLNQTAAQRAQAEADYRRLKALADRQVISEKELESAALALEVAQEAQASARASSRETLVREQEILSGSLNVEQLEAGLAIAQAQRDKSFIRAPFDGLVAEIMPDVGESANAGLPLVQLVDDSRLYIEAPFDEANAGEIRVGQRARITVDTFRGEEFWGTVEYIPPVVQMNPDLSRTLNIRIAIDEGDTPFAAGMSADVVILIESKDDALYVPTQALVREEFAYVVEDGVAVRRRIEPGIGNWDTREVLSGLEEGETLITTVAMTELQDGVPVRVVDDREAAAP